MNKQQMINMINTYMQMELVSNDDYIDDVRKVYNMVIDLKHKKELIEEDKDTMFQFNLDLSKALR